MSGVEQHSTGSSLDDATPHRHVSPSEPPSIIATETEDVEETTLHPNTLQDDSTGLETELPQEEERDNTKQTAHKPKSSASSRPGQSNGSPLVKKIINSGTFGSGTISKTPPAKSTANSATVKPSARPSVASGLRKSTTSNVSATKPTTIVTQARGQSTAPLKAPAPTIPKPSSTPTNVKSPMTSGKPTSKAPGVAPPVRSSPTGAATLASSKHKALASDETKRTTSRQSLPAATKAPLSASSKPSSSRPSALAISSSKAARTNLSISSIQEVQEHVKAPDNLPARRGSSVSEAENLARLEARVSELIGSLETVSADVDSKTALSQQLASEKLLLEKQLSEVKDALAQLERQRDEDKSILIATQENLMKATSASEEVESFRSQIQTLKIQLKDAQESLDLMRSSNISHLEQVAGERETFLKAQTENAALMEEVATLKAAHAQVLQEAGAKINDLTAKVNLIDELNMQIAKLQNEKEETLGKLSELEVEVLEMKDAQEANEDERARLTNRIKSLEKEITVATDTTNKAYDAAKAKDVEVLAQLEELQAVHAAALDAMARQRDELAVSFNNVKDELRAALIEEEEAEVLARTSAEKYDLDLQTLRQVHAKQEEEQSGQIQRISLELEKQEAYYNSKVDSVKDEHNRLLEEAFERAKTEARDAHTKELQSLRAGSEASIEQIQNTNKLNLEDLKAEHANILDSEVSRFEKSIASIKLELKATQDDLVKAKAALEATRAEITSLTQQRDEARVAAADTSGTSAQLEEVTRLTKELSNAKDDLSATSEMLNLTRVSLTEMSNNHAKDLEDATTVRVQEVTSLRVAHDEEIAALSSEKTELVRKVSDLEGELATLKVARYSEQTSQKNNENGVTPSAVPVVSKEELQRLHEAHNLKIYDLQAEHDQLVKAFKEELGTSQNKVAELNAEVQRKIMEIQYLEQDQEESQEQIARLKADLEILNKHEAP